MNHAIYPLTIEDPMVFTRLNAGKIELLVSLSNEIDTSDALNAALLAWVEDTDPVEIKQRFTISAPVNYMIQGYSDVNGLLDAEAKSVFDAIRAEMLVEVARIDALVYSAELESNGGSTE